MRTLIAATLMASGAAALAAESSEPTDVVVTATRLPESSRDIAASIDRLDSTFLQRGQLQVNLSESLLSVPGVAVQSRQNYAQDLQLSVRGFGARSSFGVRGVRLFSDGIPGTMPDGQGQFSQFDLGSADHIEVLRGPFSALYGNSSGGVLAMFTQDAPPGYSLAGSADYGTFNTQRYAVKSTGANPWVNYLIDAVHFATDGFRTHSEAERNNVNSKVSVAPTDTSKLTLIGNAVETPFVQDPLGLTRQQLSADPSQAGSNALLYDTRKSLAQEQLGASYEAALDEHDTLVVSGYGGHRATTQFQAIPKATQVAAALYPGAVIDLDRNYYGLDAHLADVRAVAGMPLKWIGGLAYDDLAEARRGFANYAGSHLGVEGALRRDEANHVYDVDEYLQGEWDPAAAWHVMAGVRHSVVEVSSHGHIPVLDGADSGARYSATNPVAGITYRVRSNLNAYASYGRGFETPTLNDLAYRSIDGSLPGLNVALRPARSDNYEMGLKLGQGRWRADLAAFHTKTHDELAVLQNSSGRTVNQNIGETSRRGLELSLDGAFQGGLSTRLAYTYIRAVVDEDYFECIAAPCNPLPALGNPSIALPGNYRRVGAGAHLPAVPANSLYAGLSFDYRPMGFSSTLEAQARARIYTDDRNSDAAAAFWVFNWRAGLEQQSRHWHFSEYLRIDNLADRAYVGSVIVNETNQRYFEPAPGRTAYIMFNAQVRD
jgi:iron complex outermembrane receptor protein